MSFNDNFNDHNHTSRDSIESADDNNDVITPCCGNHNTCNVSYNYGKKTILHLYISSHLLKTDSILYKCYQCFESTSLSGYEKNKSKQTNDRKQKIVSWHQVWLLLAYVMSLRMRTKLTRFLKS